LFKLVLIGDSCVGKSCLLIRFADDNFTENYITTIGVDFRFRTLPISKKTVKLQIWDTAGQERYRTITNAYYRGADGIIIVFDLTNKESFLHVQDWIKEVEKYSSESVVMLVLGNKCDLDAYREVTPEDIKEFTKETGLTVLETSAKTSDHVDDAFLTITKNLMQQKDKLNQDDGDKSGSTKLKKKIEITKSKLGCCNQGLV